MTHDPLCPVWDHVENHEDTYWCSDACDEAECQCDLIAKVSERALSAQIDTYRHGWDMGVAEAREAVLALPWHVSMMGATVLRTDLIKAIEDLQGES